MMTRLAKFICFLVISNLLLGCGVPRYHSLRMEPLFESDTTIEEKIKKINMTLSDTTNKENIKEVMNFMKERLPDGYFDSKKDKDVKFLKSVKPHVEVVALPYQYQTTETIDTTNTFNPNKKVRLIVSASLNSINPADRLEKVYTLIFITKKAAKIADIEKLETEKPKNELFKVTDDSKIETVFKEITPSFSKKLEQTIFKEFAKRNIDINSNRDILFIRQDGLEGIDLSGNIITTMTLELNIDPVVATTFSNIPEISDKLETTKIAIETFPFLNNGDVKGIIVWIAQVRRVTAREGTIEEGDDEVVPSIFTGVQEVILWRNPKILYTIMLKYKPNNEGKECVMARLVYERPGLQSRAVAFTNYSDAFKFRDHVIKKYIEKRPELSSDQPIPLMLCEDKENKEKAFKVGFRIDTSGKEMPDDPYIVNIVWKDKEGKPVNLNPSTELNVDITVPSDYPLKNVWRITEQ